MRAEALMLSAVVIAAAEPGPPVVAVHLDSVTLAVSAGWEGSTWKLTRDDLTVHLVTTATATRPILRLEIQRIDIAEDGTGADLLPEDANRRLGSLGRWWGQHDDQTPTTATVDSHLELLQPSGSPPVIRRLAGTVRVFLAVGPADTRILPIDGPHRQVPVADSGLAIEVGRTEWGRPVIGLPTALVDRLATLSLTQGGREQHSSGMNSGEPSLVTLPLAPRAGDTVSLTIHPGVEVVSVPFALEPIDLTPLLGAGTPVSVQPSDF